MPKLQNLGTLQILQKFLIRLSKKEKLLFYCAVFFVFLVLLDRLTISPIVSKMRSLDKEIRDKQAGLNKDLRILAQRERTINLKNKYASYLVSAKTEDEEMIAFLKETEKLANQNSISLVELKPAGAGKEGDSKKYLVNLNCEATMEQLVSFIYSLENSDKLMNVDKYQITPRSKESNIVQCNIVISKIVLP
jgi:hypothetical protein